jgi:hypothetical protein
MMEVCNISNEDWKLFLAFFKMFLMNHKDLWIISNEIFKSVVTKRYHKSPTQVIELHEKIAEAIDRKTQNSIRKLEE